MMVLNLTFGVNNLFIKAFLLMIARHVFKFRFKNNSLFT